MTQMTLKRARALRENKENRNLVCKIVRNFGILKKIIYCRGYNDIFKYTIYYKYIKGVKKWTTFLKR